MDTWDTEETSRIIANDEGLYLTAGRLERTSTGISELADRMKSEFYDIIYHHPHSDIDLGQVDWHEIATEYLTEDEPEDEPIMCLCDRCGREFLEDNLVRQHYETVGSMRPLYLSPCCNADYEYSD